MGKMKGKKGAAINLFSRLAGVFSGLSWRDSLRSSGDNIKRKNWWGGWQKKTGDVPASTNQSAFDKEFARQQQSLQNPHTANQTVKEGNVFLLLCALVFLFSLGITVYSFFAYQEKMESLNQLIERTDQVKKDSLLIETLTDVEKRNNLLSLAVDYGYAHADDLVVYINYPSVQEPDGLTLMELVAASWKYVFFMGFSLFLFFFQRNVRSFFLKYCTPLALRFFSMIGDILRIFSRENADPDYLENKAAADFSNDKVKTISDCIDQHGKKQHSWWKALFPKKKEEKAFSSRHSPSHYLSYSSFYRRKMR